MKLLTTLLLAAALSARAQQLELKPGDHISIIGNTLADRLQHEGTLEAMIHQAFPQHDLSVRNLGYAADELTIRTRSENFGSPEEWLTKTKTDVVFAFFGFNESFKGPEGVDKFKADLEAFLKEQKAANYSGKGAPRVVLFSPIAAENLNSPDFPDGTQTNERLRYYVEAMQQVAAANAVPFVDLFKTSKSAYETQPEPLTVNGIHLRNQGYAALAPAIFKSLFGKDAPVPNPKLVEAVNEKNWQWHQRYRTVDGYNVYGGRSQLAFPQGKDAESLKNYTTMQEEMTQRDVMTANREKRVHALAKGTDITVDDSNLPPVREVKTNKPGKNPDQSHPYPTGEEVIGKVKLHAGLKMNLFADEKMFPELVNPVQMAWDTRGRLWVAAWPSYPERTPTGTVGDKLLVFEDTDNDGKADKCTTFLDNLNSPTGFQFWNDGVLVMQAPDLWFVRDTDGDGKGDSKEIVLNGMDSADSHHTTNAMCLDPGGATYLSDGVFHRTQVETYTGPARHADGAIWRYEPRTGKFHMHIAYGFANPHGRVFDRWGNDLVTDATGNNTYFGPAISGWLSEGKHKGIKEFWNRPSRPCPATGILSSRHFPDDWQGNFLNLNVIGFQGIYRVKVEPDGSGLKGTSLPHFLEGNEETFRPICISNAPDGSIYFCDWSQTIIGHMQHHIRDPNRDHQHGRIYRVVYEGRPLLTPKKIHGESIENLVMLLAEPEDSVRERVKIELGTRDTKAVLSAVMLWAVLLDKKEPNYEHHLTEALWVHQWHNTVNLDLLQNRLASPEPNARAAAVRVALYWRDRVPDVLSIIRTAAEDEHPRVRLEAVRAASYFDTWEAADAALAALRKPTDYYLDYVIGETMRQLEPLWRRAIADGKPLCTDNPAGVNYLMTSVSTAELLKLPKTPVVYQAMLTRDGVPEVSRIEALDGMAKLKNSSIPAEAVNALTSATGAAADDIARILARQPPEELKKLREQVAKLTDSKMPDGTRQAGVAALMLADGGVKSAWTAAQKSPAALRDFLGAITLAPDAALRTAADPDIRGLFRELPAAVQKAMDSQQGTMGRYVRIELPRQGTLTLAEVEVMSGGKNVARAGKATQKNTAHGGEASRAIDGNKDTSYNGGGQTHTHENTDNPWWELDLGSELPIESVIIHNRGDNLSGRLDGFALTILDGKRGKTAVKAGNKATAEPMTVALDASPGAGLYRSAINALVSTGVNPKETFALLSQEVQAGREATAAAQAMLRLPRSAWTEEETRGAVISLMDMARRTAAEDRTVQDYIEATQATSELAGALPGPQSAAIRKALRELSVSVFVIKTVPEQMRYNTARLVVEAGKPFEIIFENPDFMPHNLVLAQPGSREEIGTDAQTMPPDKLDPQGRAYIPANPKIFAATRLLESGQSERLKLTAPSQEGKYEIVCTFPGHWMAMWAKLIVTKDVDGYLAKHPQPEELPPTFTQPEAGK
jgi:azurin